MAKTPKRPTGRNFDWRSIDPTGELSKPYEEPVTDSEGRLRPKNYKEGNRPVSEPSSRPAKDIKPGDIRSQTIENKGRTLKPRPARDIKPGDLRQKVLDELKAGPKKPVKAADLGKGGARAKFLKDAKAGTIKAAAKTGSSAAGKAAVTAAEEGGSALARFGRRAAPYAGRVLGTAGRTIGSALGGRAAIIYTDMIDNAKPLNAGEKEWIADKKNRGPLMPGNKKYDKPIGPERPARTYGEKIGPKKPASDDYTKPYRTYDKKIGPNAPRGTAGTYTKSYDVKPKAPSASVSSVAAPKKAGDKSTQASKAKPSSVTGTPAKTMTNFERMKARQYEKEGYGGRSMTSAGAKAQVEKERGYKLPTGRLTFGAKAASKPASGASKSVKQGSTNTFASKMQGRNVPGSPTYSPTKAKSGFKFSDIFNRKK